MVWVLGILAVIMLLMFIYLLLIKPSSTDAEKMRPFEERLIAHRGLFTNPEIPENSLTAFFEAVKNGYPVELDVQTTKDNKLVVFHDDNLQRICGINKKLTDCSYDELINYRLFGTNEIIPLFDDVLKLIDEQVPIVIEIKSSGDYIKTAKLLNERLKSYKGVYCVESFNTKVLMWYKKHSPETLRGQLSTNFRKDNSNLSAVSEFVMTNLLLNFLTKPDFIAYSHKYPNQFSFTLCRKLYKVKTIAWTIRNQEELEKAKQYFDGIIFDSFKPQ